MFGFLNNWNYAREAARAAERAIAAEKVAHKNFNDWCWNEALRLHKIRNGKMTRQEAIQKLTEAKIPRDMGGEYYILNILEALGILKFESSKKESLLTEARYYLNVGNCISIDLKTTQNLLDLIARLTNELASTSNTDVKYAMERMGGKQVKVILEHEGEQIRICGKLHSIREI